MEIFINPYAIDPIHLHDEPGNLPFDPQQMQRTQLQDYCYLPRLHFESFLPLCTVLRRFLHEAQEEEGLNQIKNFSQTDEVPSLGY